MNEGWFVGERGILSWASHRSILSIGSAGSILSVLSAGSILSLRLIGEDSITEIGKDSYHLR